MSVEDVYEMLRCHFYLRIDATLSEDVIQANRVVVRLITFRYDWKSGKNDKTIITNERIKYSRSFVEVLIEKASFKCKG